MIYISKQGKIENCFGCGTVAFDPKYYENNTPVVNFAINVETWKTHDAEGNTDWMNIRYNATAFGDLAKYCRYLEKGDTIIFLGHRVIDDYATKKDPKMETKYKVMLQACIVQPLAPELNPDGTFDDEQEYDDIPL